jgi:hypothetical protein
MKKLFTAAFAVAMTFALTSSAFAAIKVLSATGKITYTTTVNGVPKTVIIPAGTDLSTVSIPDGAQIEVEGGAASFEVNGVTIGANAGDNFSASVSGGQVSIASTSGALTVTDAGGTTTTVASGASSSAAGTSMIAAAKAGEGGKGKGKKGKSSKKGGKGSSSDSFTSGSTTSGSKDSTTQEVKQTETNTCTVTVSPVNNCD